MKMRLNIINLLTIGPLIFLTSCITQDIQNLESALNADVGTEFKGVLKNNPGWSQININSSTVELEQKRTDGCSYAYLIDLKSKIVLSWRYTSSRESCDIDYFKTGA
jgi:hypothetical protein